jgi:hypothetical protein
MDTEANLKHTALSGTDNLYHTSWTSSSRWYLCDQQILCHHGTWSSLKLTVRPYTEADKSGTQRPHTDILALKPAFLC